MPAVSSIFHHALNGLVKKFGGCFDRQARQLVFPLCITSSGDVLYYSIAYDKVQTASDLVEIYIELKERGVEEQA